MHVRSNPVFAAVRRALLVALLAVMLNPGAAAAWSRTGHMMIAAMAYRHLPADLKIHYTELLRHHPDSDAWMADYENLEVDLELGEYLFMVASYWPDQIRRSGGKYNHPTWHYTNFPLIAPAFPLEETLTPEDDVLFGIAESRRILADASADPVDRAAHLSWILHLIGDMHQPLHSVALVNATYPDGDRGGNDVFIRPAADRNAMNLHAFWDGLLGTRDDVRQARNEATRLLSSEAATPVARDFDVRAWALESRSVAIEQVYLNGRLETATEEASEDAPVLPAGYARQAESVAERQAVRAGYRMAAVLAGL